MTDFICKSTAVVTFLLSLKQLKFLSLRLALSFVIIFSCYSIKFAFWFFDILYFYSNLLSRLKFLTEAESSNVKPKFSKRFAYLAEVNPVKHVKRESTHATTSATSTLQTGNFFFLYGTESIKFVSIFHACSQIFNCSVTSAEFFDFMGTS